MVGWRFAALGDSKSLMLPSLQTGGTLVVPLQVGSLSAATSWMLPPSTSGFDSGSVSSLDWARSLIFFQRDKATQLIPKQTVPQSADPRAKTAPPLNLQIEDAPNTSIIPLERPSAARFPEEAGSSTLPVITREPIIVESSPSDELPPPIPEMGAAILPTQAEEIHFKELRSPMMKKSHRAK
ncbi:uncharacterized protein LOC101783654 isoform X2 [Setaria italica]|uniref:uncharacterized protein LOC101783654 isoform X2 n=1 Tax=Setaria italica TaxID=4555 RepID=UPI00035128F8|nr:uncharacterized protein LOC101783654 isoform X2 [Setaria italica]